MYRPIPDDYLDMDHLRSTLHKERMRNLGLRTGLWLSWLFLAQGLLVWWIR